MKAEPAVMGNGKAAPTLHVLQRKMKYLKSSLPFVMGTYIGFLISWIPPHPARLAVTEVKKEIINYYEANEAVPASLDFIKEKGIKSDILSYKITWDPQKLKISSEGNWTYEPGVFYRLSFGLIGKRVASAHGNPGHFLDHTIPKGTKVEPVGVSND